MQNHFSAERNQLNEACHNKIFEMFAIQVNLTLKKKDQVIF